MNLTFILEPGARVEKAVSAPHFATKLIGIGFDLGTTVRLSHDHRTRARLLADVSVESVAVNELLLIRLPVTLAHLVDWESSATTHSGGRAMPLVSGGRAWAPIMSPGATVRVACWNTGAEAHTFTLEFTTITAGGNGNGF